MSAYVIDANGVVTRINSSFDLSDEQKRTCNKRARQVLPKAPKNNPKWIIAEWVKEMEAK